ncbi:MAG: hypothetical protein JWN39_3396 [Ilumatobacteraceae bacterium]|nr:hypothetical protein [Ilumatobacteraceae bacterium]
MELGFEFDQSIDAQMTTLDTFDGRLHRAGLRLTLLDADRLTVELAQPGASARASIVTRPQFATNLPDGIIRSTVEAAVGVRPLLPVLRFRALTTRAVHSEGDRVLAEVALYERIGVVGGEPTNEPAVTGLIELRGMAGSPKPARRAVKALAALELDPIDGDAFDVVAGSVGVVLDGGARPATVVLDADGPAVAGVREVLVNLATSIEINWQGTVDNADTDFLHDLRVAVRRTRSIIAQTKGVLPPSVAVRANRRFTWLSDLTGPARDLDVYLLEWDDYTDALDADSAAALEPVRALLLERQVAAHAELTRALLTPRGADLLATWRDELTDVSTFEPQGEHAESALGSVVRQRIIHAQSTLIDLGRLIEPETPAEQVHGLRKDAKRLRYLLECFASILADGPRKKFVKRLKALQDNLGTHQDAEVHVALLREIAGELGASAHAETLDALGQLTDRLEEIRLTARAKFASRFATYDTETTMTLFDEMLEGLDP